MYILPTRITELDEMLNTGFVIPGNFGDYGYTILVTGESGTGKTILGLQMAANYAEAHPNESAVHLSCPFFENDIRDHLTRYFTIFGFMNKAIVQSVSEAQKISDDNEALPGHQGGLVLAGNFVGGEINDFETYLRGELNGHEELSEKPGFYVVDSLDQLLFKNNGSISNQQQRWQKAIQPFYNFKKVCVLITENYGRELGRIVDAVIELSITHEGLEAKRHVEVVKARYQSHYMGKKPFDINAIAGGIVIS